MNDKSIEVPENLGKLGIDGFQSKQKKLPWLTPLHSYFSEVLHTQEKNYPWFFTDSCASQSLIAEIFYASQHDMPVLVTGETGTGKELVAKFIHEVRMKKSSLNKAECPWVPINSASIPENLAESVLFGHERGAFTSARERQKGKFEIAKSGTLFIDEAQCLSMSTQSKLLRAIQHREVDRIGGQKPVPINCQVVVATNEPLEALVKQGVFREDLFFRINITPVHLPPLRKKRNELPWIAKKMLEHIQKENPIPKAELSEAAIELLLEHSWPGNFRELEFLLMYGSIRSSDGVIHPFILEDRLQASSRGSLL
jgi:DNA-binding NtrC family response regulator